MSKKIIEGGFIPEINNNNNEEEEEERKELKEEVCDFVLPVEDNKKCKFCSSISSIDNDIFKVFKIIVCKTCKYIKINLITKTNARSNYLVTEEELSQFKFICKPNPHRGGKSSMGYMYLYLEDEISDFSVKKHGSLDNVTEIIRERARILERRKLNNLKKRVKSLRKKTVIITEKIKHIHKFIQDGDLGKCECGLEIEMDTI